MKRKNLYITLTILVIIIAAAVYYFTRSKELTFQFRTDTVKQGDISVVVTATGTLSAVQTVNVGSQVSGVISNLYVDWNDHVKAGEIIAQIDTLMLSASLQDAQSTVDRSQASVNDAQRTYNRMKALYDRKLASQSDYDASLTALELAKGNLKSAIAQFQRSKANLDYATIRAPINGVVIGRSVDPGQTVAASFSAPTIFTIANDLKKMQVLANVDEADIGQVKTGMPVSFSVDAYPNDQFMGEVFQIRLNPVIVSNVVNYTVVINTPNNDLRLMPGMTANVSILTAKRDSVIKIPALALTFRPTQDLLQSKYVDIPEQYKARMLGGQGGGRSGADSTRRGGSNDSSRRGGSDQAGGQQSGQRQGGPTGNVQGGGSGFGGGRHGNVIWILGKDGKIRPTFVMTGLTDGSFTELIRGKLEVGDQVVLGVFDTGNSSSSSNSNQTNPFAPRMGGMRGR